MKKILIAFCVVISFASCKKGTTDRDNGEDVQRELAVTPVGQPSGNAVQKQIGPSGGSVTSSDGKITISFPQGALEGTQQISVQSISNEAPSGMAGLSWRLLPHGISFKKPVTLVMKYNEKDVAGTLADFINLATQLENGTWKKTGAVNVDRNNKTVTATLNHFSDYSFYTAFHMKDVKTKTDTAIIHLSTTEKVRFDVIEELEWQDGLTVPILAAGWVYEWAINGVVNPPLSNNFGYMGDGLNLAQREYVAPRRKPLQDTIAVSAKLNLGSRGVMWLVRTVVIDDINNLKINGRSYPNAIPTAIAIVGGFLGVGMLEQTPNGSADVSLTVEELFEPVPGTYQYNASEKVKILASDEFGNRWSSQRTLPNGQKEYSGSAEIIVTGSGNRRYITGKITGTLFGSDGTQSSGVVDARFSVELL